ncbi:transporter substrate-binding domain-containing protein [Rhizobium leguminosarum bv. viciae]|nr:transporter substrate-binding domain-containing protein [Rhizobium leguminosarum bv. viciae]
MTQACRLFVLVLIASFFPFQPFAQAADVVIAVRDDARPFVWKDAYTNDYRGFFWDICSLAVQKAGYFPVARPIDAAQRKNYLDTGVGDYDLLCDPTTITVNRLKTFVEQGPDLTFSPIVFVANGTYVGPSPTSPEGMGSGKIREVLQETQGSCDALLKAAESASGKKDQKDEKSSDERWIRFLPKPIEKVEADKKEDFQIWGYLEGSTIAAILNKSEVLKTLNDNNAFLICPNAFPSHANAAEAFCAGNLARYYGDGEIIKAAILAFNEKTGGSCGFVSARLATYEPYAFVLSSRKVREFPQRFTFALYSMFADQTVERLFAAHFPEEKSEFLTTLYRINRIPKGVPTAPPQ